jgi:hypothetical protein
MDQDGHGQEVEGQPDCVWETRARPLEGRNEHREAGGDHQGSKAAVGPSRPRDKPTEDVRHGDPVHERGLKAWLGHVIARQRQREGCDGRR